MKEKTERKLTLTTKRGCHRLLAIFIVAIFLSGFFAALFQTDFGKIKFEHVTFDARGATLNGELYYPAGTTSHDKLPAVIVTHGGANTYGMIKNIASELARRKFVVLNFSAYGQGLSEQPDYDDSDQGADGLNVVKTPAGMLDAVNFVRSLKFVDTTRIGIYGHSMGAYRADYTVIGDCGFFSFNDIMINVLYEVFNQTFTENEIYQNADGLAAARLNKDQLAHYKVLREQYKNEYDNSIKAVCIMGINRSYGNDVHTVNVGGHEVNRSLQTNIAFINGEFDEFMHHFESQEVTKAAWYSPDTNLEMGSWYTLDDENASSSIIGTFYGSSVAGDDTLNEAVSNRTARVFYVAKGLTHTEEIFSTKTSSAITKYFEQTLQYNRGELRNSATIPLDARSNIWFGRVVFNTISMFAMFGMLIALCALLIRTEFFRSIVIEVPIELKPKFNRNRYWLFSAITVLVTFFVIYYSNLKGLGFFGPSKAFPLARPQSLNFTFFGLLAIFSVILVTVYSILGKKETNCTGLKALNIGIGFKNILKSILLGIILIIVSYVSMAMLEYFFGQDYRIWQTAFTEMKADYWFFSLRYIAVIFPMFFFISAGINYTVRTDIPVWKDTLITVLVNSVGIWICCVLGKLLIDPATFTGKYFSDFLCSWAVVFLVPLTTYLHRKLFNLTKNIWVSTATITILIVWYMTCTLGIGDSFYGQTVMGNFLQF